VIYPAAANTECVTEGITVSFSAFDQTSFQERIAFSLEEKGLEKPAAERLSKTLVGDESILFDKKVQNLTYLYTVLSLVKINS
jgi:hypothetical protein